MAWVLGLVFLAILAGAAFGIIGLVVYFGLLTFGAVWYLLFEAGRLGDG